MTQKCHKKYDRLINYSEVITLMNTKTSRMPEFKEFVSRHPLVREEVVKGNKTWQNIYEEWVILGENNDIWAPYKISTEKTDKIDLLSSENLKNMK